MVTTASSRTRTFREWQKECKVSSKTVTGKKFPVMFAGAKASDEEDSPEGQATGGEIGEGAAEDTGGQTARQLLPVPSGAPLGAA
jgi:hypothetical protein